MNILSVLDYRLMRSSDYKFVLSNWSKTYRSSPWAGVIRNNRYFAEMKNTIDDLLDRGMVVIVACADDDPDQLLGFIAFERAIVPVLHYIFVKKDFRGNKIAAELFKKAGIEHSYLFTHLTEDFKVFSGGYFSPAIARRLHLEPIFNPEDKNESCSG